MSEEIEKTEEMEKYERETGKYAIWHGTITESFLKWQKGEKIYDKDKERISLYVEDEVKNNWIEFSKNNNFSTISSLIRESVNFYIENKFSISSIFPENLDSIENLSHNLKEPLTLIKGYLQIIVENYKDKLDKEIIKIINNSIEQCFILERKIVENLDKSESIVDNYDILIIEDNVSTVNLLKSYFEAKGYACKSAFTGSDGIDLLKRSKPKIILLDIILPDINGFDLCKAIKSDDKSKDILIYYLTAVPKSKVEKMMKETNADGIILKPFNLSDLNFLFNQI
jgi:CheY-like chemotaxis protein